ncbi:MAG: tRNA (adenosine(37)-N6)-threonylcarbamoyltransferase complex dimerization subunit type 1 TsaB [Bacteroidetes bacterium]|nr:tRNA (adenosine(37)-N6)-threonylcarbamoyltransferase complex dimerization subunit type 1 TsaB [Bacteroidota bacterium]MCY4204758.1 tRNA (adenosine(37)-N6)-threonylcarbamoyltransferase complex dimerization subunit type 1 TsaB [Bacteroidota bacterium]
MYTLVLDTSGPYTTVLITQNNELSIANILKGRPAEYLHEQIQTSLKSVNLTPKNLDRIAVVIGPGSWTGLNIGVTAAKTLAQVLNLPLLPLNTLDALVSDACRPVWGLMSAGRNRCYYARYSISQSPEMAVDSIDLVIKQIETDSASVIEYGEVFREKFCQRGTYLSVDRLLPEALMAALETSRILLTGDSIKSLTPAYLQPSHVERDAPH